MNSQASILSSGRGDWLRHSGTCQSGHSSRHKTWILHLAGFKPIQWEFLLKFGCFSESLPRWLLSDKESACQWRSRRRIGWDPWVGKTPRRRKWQPISWTEEPGGLQYLGPRRVGCDWASHAERGTRIGDLFPDIVVYQVTPGVYEPPWKKSCDQPRQHIKKQRHYFVNKGRQVNAMVFPVVMYGCESWTVKKAESWRIDAFELWCWRRLLRVPWTARRSNQSILKEISPEYSLEALMLKLKLHTLATWCEELIGKDPDARKDLRLEEKGTTEDEMVGWHHRLMVMSLSKFGELRMDRKAWRAAVQGVTKSLTGLSDWTELRRLKRNEPEEKTKV